MVDGTTTAARMADEGAMAPEENCEYPVVLGRSMLAHDEDEINSYPGEEDTAAHAVFQYKFTPASVDTSIPGLVSVDDSGTATVLRGTSSNTEDGVTFKGKLSEQKETECLLIFDGSSFRLERCDFAVSQLRHVRSAPAYRPHPSAIRAPNKSDYRPRGGRVSRGQGRGRGRGRGARSKQSEPPNSSSLAPAPSIEKASGTTGVQQEQHSAQAVVPPQTKRRRTDPLASLS